MRASKSTGLTRWGAARAGAAIDLEACRRMGMMERKTTAGRGYSELRPEHRGHGARAPADPRRHPARPVRQPRLLPDVPRLARGDRGPPDLRAGQRPVGHPRPADPARGHRPQELRLRRLRARAHLPGHRPQGDAAQRPQAPGGPPRRAAGPGDGGRDRAQAGGRSAAQGRRVAERDLQQRQLLEHRHRREGRHSNLQRRRRAHAGLHGRRGDEQDHPGRHLRSAGSDHARQSLERRAWDHDHAGL